MRVPAERRAELHLEALKRIADSGENDYRKYLLAECLEAYTNLDEEQRRALQELLSSEPFENVRPLMVTTYERGKIEGKIEGKAEGRTEGRMEERREMVLFLLETKFNEVSDAIKTRVAELSPDELRQLFSDLLKAEALQDVSILRP